MLLHPKILLPSSPSRPCYLLSQSMWDTLLQPQQSSVPDPSRVPICFFGGKAQACQLDFPGPGLLGQPHSLHALYCVKLFEGLEYLPPPPFLSPLPPALPDTHIQQPCKCLSPTGKVGPAHTRPSGLTPPISLSSHSSLRERELSRALVLGSLPAAPAPTLANTLSV